MGVPALDMTCPGFRIEALQRKKEQLVPHTLICIIEAVKVFWSKNYSHLNLLVDFCYLRFEDQTSQITSG